MSCDVSEIKTIRGANGYIYKKPEGRQLELPKLENDYLPPSNDIAETTTTTTTPASPSNEYLPAADPISNDYLPPSSSLSLSLSGIEAADEESIVTTAANII